MRALISRSANSTLIVLIVLATFAGGTRSARAQFVADPYESSIAMLRQAITPQRDGSHLPLLFALRQLRDAGLGGLFQQLVQQANQKEHWPMQVHAVLGLAEIDPKKQIDPHLIAQVTPEAQEAIIASALDARLLPDSMLSEVLASDQLTAMTRLFLLAERQLLKQPLDIQELARLSKSDDSHVAGLSAALLAQNGIAEPLKSFDTLLAAKPANERLAVTLWLMDGARRYQLTALSDWIVGAMSQKDADPDVVYRGTLALLSLDPARGVPAWERYLGDNPSFPHRVRCGTILLAARSKPPASAYDRLLPAAKDEELIARIADVGKALANNSDPAPALIALLDVGHAKTSLWAMEYLKEMPTDQSRPVHEYLIDRMNEPKVQWSEGVGQAVEATARLFEIDPDGVLARLSKAEDDSALQQAILLGLFETTSPRVGEAAAALPRIGSGRADSLALLLQAKHAKSLTADQLKQLGTIASGGGRLSEILQVQAAWLYLRHSGKTEQAIAEVFTRQQ
ncbi:MAG TPA: hypothetical protein VMS30_10940 [Phycisphaerales bacterium]|nr:hypothetical protein [Phycisphaerales bacterium]